MKLRRRHLLASAASLLLSLTFHSTKSRASTNTPSYTWRMGGQSGGGFANAMAASSNGLVAVAGDVWSFAASDNYGDNWYRTMKGVAPAKPWGRCVAFSKKYPGRKYVGIGTLKFASNTGGGYLGVIDPASSRDTLQQLNMSVSFTSNLPTGGAGDLPRPTGRLIVVDWNPGSADEYIYMATRQGVFVSKDKGVTLHRIGNLTPPGTLAAWSCLTITPSGTLYLASFRTSETGGSRLWKISSPRKWANGSVGTIQEITPLPGGIGVIEDMATVRVGGTNILLIAAGRQGLIRSNGVKVMPGDSNLSICSIDQGPDGTVWIGQGLGDSQLRYVAKSKDLVTWNWVTQKATYTDNIAGTSRPWWLNTEWPGLNKKGYSISQVVVAPDNPSIVYAAGRSGIWVTKNAGATWSPCMNGYDGSESAGTNAEGISGQVCGPAPGEWWASDTDFHWSHTLDNWVNADCKHVGPGQIPPALSLSRSDSQGNIYEVRLSPLGFLVNGVDVADELFRASAVNPKDVCVDEVTQRVVVALNGGVLVGDPS